MSSKRRHVISIERGREIRDAALYAASANAFAYEAKKEYLRTWDLVKDSLTPSEVLAMARAYVSMRHARALENVDA